MPRCSSWLRQDCAREEPCYDHFETDADAVKHLESRGYSTHRFVIRPPREQEITQKDRAAICFLLNEWDYGWDGPDLE